MSFINASRVKSHLPSYTAFLIATVIALQFATVATPDEKVGIKHFVSHARVAIAECRHGYEDLRGTSPTRAQAWLEQCAVRMQVHMDAHYNAEWNAPGSSRRMKIALSTFYAQWQRSIDSLSMLPDETPVQYERRIYATEQTLQRHASEIIKHNDNLRQAGLPEREFPERMM
jgi:hypothetical protein